MADVEKLKEKITQVKTELKKIDGKKDLIKFREKKKELKRLQRKVRQITGKKLEAIKKKKAAAEEGTKPAQSQQAQAVQKPAK